MVSEVANAAWAGRRADGGTPPAPIGPAPEPDPDPVIGVAPGDLASILTILLGTIAGMVGAGVWFGWPAALVVLWVTAVPIGVLLGWGDRR